jgi:hypothetical protein
VYAKAQLTFIQQYLEDFTAIIKNVLEKKEEVRAEIKRKKENNEII